MITIKELKLDSETALKLIKLIKKEEPEIWEVLKGELTEALNMQNVSKCDFQIIRSKVYSSGRSRVFPNMWGDNNQPLKT